MTMSMNRKRKRGSARGSSPSGNASEEDLDISIALTGKTGKSMEDGAMSEEELIRQSIVKRNKKDGTEVLKKTKGKTKLVKGEIGGGSFQSMGLHPAILRALTLRGFRTPTPIQRLAIPVLLSTPPRDLVGMARTGSGKTLAYLVPLLQRLGGMHSTTFGARALVLLPTRELALQVLKVGKDLARGWTSAGAGGDHAGDTTVSDSKHVGGLRWGLVVGGEGLDEQFDTITNNPDVIIATPGRLLHVIVEMNLDLRLVQYVVFDEADRLFEMGFATPLNEIIGRLPAQRQTLLFSATLPKSLLEFAKAGLQNPKLVRLDSESKISSDLRMAFFSVKQAEKEASLLILLRDIIKVPLDRSSQKAMGSELTSDAKKKGKQKEVQELAPHQTLIFVATKHHVEYLVGLLAAVGYSVSHIYGTLDQAARTQQMDRFRRGQTNILVVTDVAARGIDIPILANVVNYDFPAGSRIFVHRVGRTARAGRTGWAWSFVASQELPHLLDLQLFLGRPLAPHAISKSSYVSSLVLGALPRATLDAETEYIHGLDDGNATLVAQRGVMQKGQLMYERSQAKASQASYRRAKEMAHASNEWGLAGNHMERVHPIFNEDSSSSNGNDAETETARRTLMMAVNSFTPSETVFEIGSRGKEGASLMKERRKTLQRAVVRATPSTSQGLQAPAASAQENEDDAQSDLEMADEADIEAAFETSKNSKQSFRDSDFYMSHYQEGAETERGYSLKDGASFDQQARSVAFDLAGDETLAAANRRNTQLNWDRKKKKFVRGSGEGKDNVAIVRTESGTRLPATYKSGRFDEWKSKHRGSLPRTGEQESETPGPRRFVNRGKKFKHSGTREAKPLDKLAFGYERKVAKLKGKSALADDAEGGGNKKLAKGKKITSRYGGKPMGRVKNELKSADQIRKGREVVERRRLKNARPSRNGKSSGRRKR